MIFKLKNKRAILLDFNIILLLGIVFLLLHLITNILPQKSNLWGLFYISFLPLWQQLLFSGLALIGLIYTLIADEQKSIFKYLHKPVILNGTLLLLAIIAGAFFYFFRSRHLLWGDSSLSISTINGPLFIGYNEIGEIFIHRAFSRVAQLFSSDISGASIYMWSSIIAGWIFLFIWLLYTIKQKISCFLKVSLFIMPLALGSILLFFGHSEHYSFFFVSVLLYLISSISTMNTGDLVFPTLTLGLSILMHMAGLSLIPSFFVLVYLKDSIPLKGRIVFLSVSLAICLSLLIPVVYYLLNTSVKGQPLLLQPLPSSQRPYAIFSFPHIRDMLNYILLSAITPFIFIVADFKRFHKNKLFLWVAALSCLLAAFLIDPLFEAGDWDLMAFISLPFMFLGLESFNDPALTKNKILPIGITSAFILIHVLPWVLVNASTNMITNVYDLKAGIYSHSDKTFMYVRGTKYYAEINQYQKTLELGLKGLSYDSTDVRLYHNLGVAAYREKLYPQAIKWETKAVKYDSNYTSGLIILASSYFKLGEYDKAVPIYIWATSVSPKDPEIYFYLGSAYAGWGKYRESLLALQKAISINPLNSQYYHSQFYNYFVLGQYMSALESVDHILLLQPRDTKASLYKGIVLFLLNNQKEAVRQWQSVLDIDPYNKKATALLSLYYQGNLSRQILLQEP